MTWFSQQRPRVSPAGSREAAKPLPRLFSEWGLLLLGFSLLLSSCARTETKKISEIKCYPPEIHLAGANGRQSVLVQATYTDGITRDITADSRCRLADSRVAGFDGTNIITRANGQTDFLVTYAGRTLSVPVTVTNAGSVRAISFNLDVMPVFMKAGCT